MKPHRVIPAWFVFVWPLLLVLALASPVRAQDLTTLLAKFLVNLYAGTVDVGGTSDALLVRDAANVIGQRNGTTAQESRLYNTWTSSTNFEAVRHYWASNVAWLVADKGSGGGTGRQLNIGTIGANSLVFVTSGSVGWQQDSGGNFTFSGTENTTDIGALGARRPRTGYFATSVIAPTINATTQYQLNGTNGVGFALAHANPANQTGNATATLKMNGLGAAAAPCIITPTSSGRIIFTITGQVTQSTTADGAVFKLAEGTGAPPANAAAATGTVISATQTWTGLTGNLTEQFAITASATGFALSTAVWFDLQIADVTGGTAGVINIDCTANEI